MRHEWREIPGSYRSSREHAPTADYRCTRCIAWIAAKPCDPYRANASAVLRDLGSGEDCPFPGRPDWVARIEALMAERPRPAEPIRERARAKARQVDLFGA